MKGSEAQKKDHMNFYECCDFTKKYIWYIYMYYHPIKELLSWQGTKRKPLIFSSNPNFTICRYLDRNQKVLQFTTKYCLHWRFNRRYIFLSSIHTLVFKKNFPRIFFCYLDVKTISWKKDPKSSFLLSILEKYYFAWQYESSGLYMIGYGTEKNIWKLLSVWISNKVLQDGIFKWKQRHLSFCEV